MSFQYPLILDGGFATELERTFNKDLSGKLWSAKCLEDDPEAVKSVHKSYYEAGSNIATTCSYQASIEGFSQAGYTRDHAIELMHKSISLACEARKEFIQEHPENTSPKLVALSIGCYGAILANGAEYTGNYGDTSVDQLVQFHKERLSVFLQSKESKVDFILFETIPSALEARAIASIVSDFDLLPPVAVSFQCRSDHDIADGTPLQDVLALFDTIDHVFATGINCTKPQFIESLIDIIVKHNKAQNSQKVLLLYPDGGEVWDAVARTWDTSCKLPEDKFGYLMAKCVKEYGPRVIVGGCCGTGFTHIRNLKSHLHK
ncbi:hypothetical protein RMATCC62417_07291 [Rhizopus microsporus]|nr:hypothetical protein RMATCC62417_07291 [Rhizopus microsporus]